MKFAGHYLYQSSFPEYMGEEVTVKIFVSMLKGWSIAQIHRPGAPWRRKLKHWFLSGVEELRFNSE